MSKIIHRTYVIGWMAVPFTQGTEEDWKRKSYGFGFTELESSLKHPREMSHVYKLFNSN